MGNLHTTLILTYSGPIHALTYSASPGTYILTGSADRGIRLYNPSSSSSSATSTTTTTTTTTTTHSSSYITKPQQIQQSLSTLPEGRLIQTYTAHSHEVLSLAVTPDNARFASAGGDRTVFLWDVSTATPLRRFSHATEGHVGRVNCVATGGADENHSLVVSGGFDTTVRIWDIRSPSSGGGGGGGGGGTRPIQVLDEARDAISAILVTRGAEIVAGSVDGRVRTYDVRMGRVVTDVIGASVTSLGLTRDGRALLVGSLDSRVRLMDRDAGTCLRTYGGDGGGDGEGKEEQGPKRWRNEEFRVQSLLGGREKYVVAGDEMTGEGTGSREEGGAAAAGAAAGGGGGRLWAWDLLTGNLVAKMTVPWGPPGTVDKLKKVVGRDGKEKERKYVVSCLAWRESGFGDQFCAGGTSGAVTVFGPA